jgi:hypothetical protein
MGYCTGNEMPGYANPYNPGGGRGMGPGFGRGYGRGFGRGFGRGRGWRFHRGYGPGPEVVYEPYPMSAPSREDELSYLEGLQKSLEQDLDEIKKRLKELSEQAKE